MALSQDQIDKLTAEAKRRGVDARKLIAAAEADIAEREPADDGESDTSTKAEEVRIFAYHHPYMTVAEVRESIGLDPSRVPEPNMTTGAWLAKHGGGAAPTPATEPEQ